MSAPALDQRISERNPVGITTPRLNALRAGQPWPPPQPTTAMIRTNRDLYVALFNAANHAGHIINEVGRAVNRAVEAHLNRPV